VRAVRSRARFRYVGYVGLAKRIGTSTARAMERGNPDALAIEDLVPPLIDHTTERHRRLPECSIPTVP
jgi:hypothetical protein